MRPWSAGARLEAVPLPKALPPASSPRQRRGTWHVALTKFPAEKSTPEHVLAGDGVEVAAREHEAPQHPRVQKAKHLQEMVVLHKFAGEAQGSPVSKCLVYRLLLATARGVARTSSRLSRQPSCESRLLSASRVVGMSAARGRT